MRMEQRRCLHRWYGWLRLDEIICVFLVLLMLFSMADADAGVGADAGVAGIVPHVLASCVCAIRVLCAMLAMLTMLDDS